MKRYTGFFKFLAAPWFLLLALIGIPVVSYAQSANDGFAPDPGNAIYALAVQPDGKILVGGLFTTISGSTRNHLARLNADGSLDTGFAVTDVDSTIYAITVQADGRIVIAGTFAQVGVYLRNRIARLNGDGTVDTAFDPKANGAVVYALAAQPDGKLLVGGFFTSLSPNGGGTIARNRIARLNTDGSVDPTYDPNANATVRVLAVQPDGKLVMGGDFTSLSPNGGDAITRNHIARLNSDGSADPTFDPNADASIRALAMQSDGKLVVGGDFTSLSPNGGGAIPRNHIARLSADGSVDAAFDPNALGSVYALVLQPDGKLVVGGQFASLSPSGGGTITRNNIARLNANGNVDTAFDPNADGNIRALAAQPDGKLLLGGFFTSLAPNGGGAITRDRLARLNADGSVDATSDPNANGTVYALALQPDGKLLVGGAFTSLSPNGGVAITRNHIARLNVDGSVDMAFDPNANDDVTALALQPDGALLLGGDFTSLAPNGGGAFTRNHIARLNADGSVDRTFNPNANGFVAALALQPDGKLVVGGAFTSFSPNDGGAINSGRIARLNTDGSVDTVFNPNANNEVYALILQPNGKLVLGGTFTSFSPNGVGAIARNHIARLNADGSVDMAFDPNANQNILVLTLQPDDKLVVGGGFSSLSPNGSSTVTRRNIARLNADGSVDMTFDPNPNNYVLTLALQADGKLVAGGGFNSLSANGGSAVTRNHIARLNGDGSVDTAFDPNANSDVYALAGQPDGKLVVGGYFTIIGTLARNGIARLSTPQAALQSLNIVSYTSGGSGISWIRGGAGPELALPPQLLFSLAGSTYAPVGTMQRISSGWRSSGFVPPLNENFYLRTRGQVSSGIGSEGLIESTFQVYLNGNDGIFGNSFD